LRVVVVGVFHIVLIAQQDDTPFVILLNEGGKGTFFLG
jgi:hypothetical protein